MADPILIARALHIAPRNLERAPAMRRVLEELRSDFDVDVLTWSSIKGGPEAPPTWQGAVDVLNQAVTPGTHLLLGGTACAIGILALQRGQAGGTRGVLEDYRFPKGRDDAQCSSFVPGDSRRGAVVPRGRAC